METTMALATQPFPELDLTLGNFRRDHPTPTGLLMMQSVDTRLYSEVFDTVKTVFAAHGISILRADEKPAYGDRLLNVSTYMHGCHCGVVVLERFTSDFFYANVSLQVGYMLALGKPILILKDTTLPALRPDLVERLCKPFDAQYPRGTVPQIIEKWLRDKSLLEH